MRFDFVQTTAKKYSPHICEQTINLTLKIRFWFDWSFKISIKFATRKKWHRMCAWLGNATAKSTFIQLHHNQFHIEYYEYDNVFFARSPLKHNQANNKIIGSGKKQQTLTKGKSKTKSETKKTCIWLWFLKSLLYFEFLVLITRKKQLKLRF